METVTNSKNEPGLTPSRFRGVVTRFFPKGFGFISVDSGHGYSATERDLFFHVSTLADWDAPSVGDVVTFGLGRDRQDRVIAIEMRRVSESSR